MRGPSGFKLAFAATFLLVFALTALDSPHGIALLLGSRGPRLGVGWALSVGLLLGLLASLLGALFTVIGMGILVGVLLGGLIGGSVGTGVLTGSVEHTVFGAAALSGMAGGTVLFRRRVKTAMELIGPVAPRSRETWEEEGTGTPAEVNAEREWDPRWRLVFFKAAAIRTVVYSTVVLLLSGIELRSAYPVSVLAGLSTFAFGEGLIRRLGGFPKRFSQQRLSRSLGAFGAALPPGIPLALGLLACAGTSALVYATVDSTAADVTMSTLLVPELMFASSLAGLLALTVEGALEYLIGGVAGLLAGRLIEGKGLLLSSFIILTAAVTAELVLRKEPDGLLGTDLAVGGQLGYLWFLVDATDADYFISVPGLVSSVSILITLRLYFTVSTLTQPYKLLSLIGAIFGLYVIHAPR